MKLKMMNNQKNEKEEVQMTNEKKSPPPPPPPAKEVKPTESRRGVTSEVDKSKMPTSKK